MAVPTGSIEEFYRGQRLLITGATGFVGKILLEKLLRCLPDISTIYCLIRPKKEVGIHQRLAQEVFGLPLFEPLKRQLGEQGFLERIQKVVPIKGDILADGLGMSPEDLAHVSSEVTVIIHGAATISFTEPLLVAVNENVLGSLRVLKLAKLCKQLQIFTHVSTAYVGCIRTGFISEKLHPLPFEPELMVDRILRLSPEEAAKQTKKLLGKHPNTYTFTKSITEHLLSNKRGKMPMVFCRPAIITAIKKDPIPGWIDTLAAAGGVYAACGFGLIKFLPGHAENATDQVPADFVVNHIITSTAFNARKNKLSIYHIGTSHRNPLRWSFVQKCLMPYWLMNPPKRNLGKPSFEFITGPYPMYELHYFLRWALPVLVYKTFARTVGDREHKKRARLLAKLETQLVSYTQAFRHFTENQWVFSTDNSTELMKRMSPEELDTFDFDSSKLDWTTYLLDYCYGLRTYALKEKGLKPPTLTDYWRRCDGLSLDDRPFSDVSFALSGEVITNLHNKQCSPEEIRFRVLTSKRVQEAIQREAQKDNKGMEFVETRAKELLSVMSAEMSPGVMRVLGWLFRKIYRKLYSGVVVNEVGLDAAKAVFNRAKNGSAMILLPTHRSYIDFLIVTFIFYSFQLPVPHIAAGDDFLNVMLVRWLFRRSGAFFMRRTLGEDDLYRAIFAEYTQRLLLEGYPLEFFLEGTRSRSGKMLQPKIGLLGIVTDPFFNNPDACSSTPTKKRSKRIVETLPDVELLPIAISYEKVVEEHAHIKELMGEGKNKMSLSGLLAAARWVLSLDFGRINVQFGNPVSLKSFTLATIQEQRQPDDSLLPLDPFKNAQDRKLVVDKLANHVCRDLNANLVCMSTSIVATIILSVRHWGISKDELTDQYKWLGERITDRGGWLDPILHPMSFIVTRAANLLQPYIQERQGRFYPSAPTLDAQRNWMHLGYYANQITYIFKSEAIIAVALAAEGYSPTRNNGEEKGEKIRVPVATLMKSVQFLDKLSRYDFIQPLDNEAAYNSAFNLLCQQQILARESYDNQIRQKGEEGSIDDTVYVLPSGERYFAFICTLMWPLVDSYWITAMSLLSLYPDRVVQESVLVARAQGFADRLFTEGILQHFESRSTDIIRNALYVFKDWGILARVPGTFGTAPQVKLLAPYSDSENALEQLISKIAALRRPALSTQALTSRSKMFLSFPVVARL